MKTTTTNNRAKKADDDLKNMIKADLLECIELVKFGIQIYFAVEGEEYSVITKAEKYKGRYYFVTREGRRVAWSSLDADKLNRACNDFMEQIKADETAEISEHTTTRHNVTAARINQVATVIAESVGVAFGSSLPANDIKLDLNNFYKWQGDAADVFYIAIRKQGTESGDRRHVRERCKILGAPVYVLRITREYDVKSDFAPAGRFCLSVWADHPITDDDQEDATPADCQEDATDESTPAPMDETTAAADIDESTPAANVADTIKKAARATVAALRRPVLKTIQITALIIIVIVTFATFATVANLCAAVVGSSVAAALLVSFPVGFAVSVGLEYTLIKAVNKAKIFEEV